MAGLGFEPPEFTGNHDAELHLLGHQRLLAILLWSPPYSVLSFLRRARPQGFGAVVEAGGVAEKARPDSGWHLGSACH